MNRKNIIKHVGLVIFGTMLSTAPLRAADDSLAAPITPNAEIGKALYEGSQAFENHGPSCIVCHNVTHSELIPGGLFAKDLTDVYERMGEGLSAWLMAPPKAPMAASYSNNPLTEAERLHLTAFFKTALEEKEQHPQKSGYSLFFIGSVSGFIGLLILIQLIWMSRKRKMVKQDIFSRQRSARDAKF